MKYLIIIALVGLASCSSISQEGRILREGNELFQIGLYSKAITKYKELLELEKSSSIAHLKIADCYDLLQENGLAIKHYTLAINIDSTNKIAFYNRAITFEEMNKPNEALKDYGKAIEMDPENINELDNKLIYQNMGILNGKIGNLIEAISSFKSALQIDEKYADAHFNLGFAHQQLGNHREAVESFDEAIKLNPKKQEYINQRLISESELEK